MRRIPALILIASLLAATGCNNSSKPQGKPVERMWEKPVSAAPEPLPPPENTTARRPAPATASAPAAAAPAPEDILAVVNGTAVTRTFAGNELIRTHGLNLLQQMVLLISARQRAQQLGLVVTPADIKAANDEALRRIAMPIGSPSEVPMDRATAERLLNEFLVAKNIARSEWERRMEQQAYLRKIATAEIEKTPISQQMLREEYGLTYGERVQIRHIQVESLELDAQVRKMLTAHKDFELVARQLSQNPVTAIRGGLMPPFTRNDPTVTPLVREAAFKMNPGDVSPAIHEDNWYHIIRLERKFPASEVGFDAVDKKELEAKVKDRLMSARIVELEAELYNKATVDVRDRDLATQFNRTKTNTP